MSKDFVLVQAWFAKISLCGKTFPQCIGACSFAKPSLDCQSQAAMIEILSRLLLSKTLFDCVQDSSYEVRLVVNHSRDSSTKECPALPFSSFFEHQIFILNVRILSAIKDSNSIRVKRLSFVLKTLVSDLISICVRTCEGSSCSRKWVA